MGLAGWASLGGALEGLGGVRSVNGWEGWGRLSGGGAETADLAGLQEQLAVAAARLLPRSAATLTALDARCRHARAAGHGWGGVGGACDGWGRKAGRLAAARALRLACRALPLPAPHI